jgi:hypothetical protein
MSQGHPALFRPVRRLVLLNNAAVNQFYVLVVQCGFATFD